MSWQIQGLKNEYLRGLKGDCDIIFGVVCGMKVTFGDYDVCKGFYLGIEVVLFLH